MNYLTGLTLGLSAGRHLHRFLRSPGFTLMHSLPGRRRYAYKELLHNPELAARFERQVCMLPNIHRAQFNPGTGTALIEYSCPDSHIDLLMEYLHQLHQAPDPQAPYGQFGMQIRRAFRHMNYNVRSMTGHKLDLRTAFAAWLGLWGVNKIWQQGQRPTGPQMLWWAYSLLQGRR